MPLPLHSNFHNNLRKADELNISQPTLTRNMQHVERDFGVPLFIRRKNKLELNETGIEAVRYAKKLIDEEKNSIRMVQQFDKNRRTITVESCAPAPLWVLLPKLSSKFPDNTISSKLHLIDELIRTSTLFCFTTEFGNPSSVLFNNRAIISVTDREANVTYHLIGKNLECYL